MRSCKVAERGVWRQINVGIDKIARAAKWTQLDMWADRYGYVSSSKPGWLAGALERTDRLCQKQHLEKADRKQGWGQGWPHLLTAWGGTQHKNQSTAIPYKRHAQKHEQRFCASSSHPSWRCLPSWEFSSVLELLHRKINTWCPKQQLWFAFINP